jgi:hypothetical protein
VSTETAPKLASAKRIVVAFAMRIGADAVRNPERYLQHIVELRERAEALGGRLCSSGAETVGFEFPGDAVEEAVALSIAEQKDARDTGSRPSDSSRPRAFSFGVGIGEGDLSPLGGDSAPSHPSWGAALVTALGLAKIARPGEVLIQRDMAAVRSGEVKTRGTRTRKDGGHPIKGLLIDSERPLRRPLAEKNLLELSRPSLSGRQDELGRFLSARAPVSVMRARPGFGGTRLLEEIEIRLAPARCLFLAAAGAEPLGALRRALSRGVLTWATTPRWSDAERRAALRLLSGEGVSLSTAAELIGAWLGAPNAFFCALLVDDVMEIDDPSLEAVALALRRYPHLRCIARMSDESPLPGSFRDLAGEDDIEIGPLSRESAEQLVISLSGGKLSPESARTFAGRGQCIPLGMVEAVLEAATTGELTLAPDEPPVRPSSRARLRLEPAEWIGRRLELLSARARRAVQAAAVLGLEVSTSLWQELLATAGAERSGEPASELVRAGWLRAHPDGSYAMASKTHREVALASLSDEERASWHAAASVVVEKLGGKLASAEAARHAALAGAQARAVDLALVAARVSHKLGLGAATEALLAFAESDVSELGPIKPVLRIDSWIETLRASGLRDGAATRLEAIAELSAGRTQRAVARLHEAVHKTEHAAPAMRSRAWLAYGIALAVAGRATEALLAGLEALAGARESGEPYGEQACARFLARLAQGVGHPDAAHVWEGVRQSRS